MWRSRIALGFVGLTSLLALLGGSAWSVAVAQAEWLQEAKLTNGAAGGHFGCWTAIEGDTAVVSAPDETPTGEVYVYHRESSGHWATEAVLTPTGGKEGDSFGQSVGLLGNTIVVGTFFDERAFVFQRSPSGGWSQTAVLQPSDGVPGDEFGFAVAISSSGIIVGAFDHNHRRGAAYIFSDASGTWRQTAELQPPSGSPEGLTFGLSVALDGSTAAVGAPAIESKTSRPGEGFVFERGSGGAWSEVGQLHLEGGGQPGDLLGRSVAISEHMVFTGATGGNIENGGNGSAYVFYPTSEGYSPGISLLRSTKPKGFGYSVAAHGSELLVGANEQEEGRGTVYQFRYVGKFAWMLQQEITSNARVAGGRFGNSVALDGSRLLIGADEVGGGAAYVFGEGT